MYNTDHHPYLHITAYYCILLHICIRILHNQDRYNNSNNNINLKSISNVYKIRVQWTIHKMTCIIRSNMTIIQYVNNIECVGTYHTIAYYKICVV